MPVLKCPAEELNVGAVLLSGQSFRWKKLAADGDENIPRSSEVFVGVAKHRVWKLWRQDDEHIGYEVLARFSKACGDDLEALRDYLQLDIELVPLYKLWVENDKYFSKLLKNHRTKLEGIRILGQDTIETIFSFICSANNHIKRITNMVETLCELYGEPVTVSSLHSSKTFHDFADPKRMADEPALEEVLRARGFGYRAPNIAFAAKVLQRDDGEQLLKRLSKCTYENAVDELQRMRGIGRKVADCICLMALRMHHVVPVDTHILQITVENYLKGLPQRKLSQDKRRRQVEAIWQEKFGPYAGWAQAVLFAAHLRQTNVQKPSRKSRRKEKRKK